MAVQVTISSVIGQSPYDVYVCQTNGSACFYITTISSTPYIFDIPAPYDNSQAYLIKLVDSKDCIISGTSRV
jgi:hypothetical protein